MKNILLLILICCLSLSNRAQEQMNLSSKISGKAIKLPGFVTSPYFEEQVISFIHTPGIKVHINAPAETKFRKDKPDPECNFSTVYLEADTKSWGSWRKAEPTRDQKIKETVEYILSLFSKYNPHIELNSHSGGGNFIFGFMDAVSEIPDYVKRISFIDSNYNWDNERYGDKLQKWLEASPDNRLFVACYDAGWKAIYLKDRRDLAQNLFNATIFEKENETSVME